MSTLQRGICFLRSSVFLLFLSACYCNQDFDLSLVKKNFQEHFSELKDTEKLRDFVDKVTKLRVEAKTMLINGTKCYRYSVDSADCTTGFNMGSSLDILVQIMQRMTLAKDTEDILQAVSEPIFSNPCNCAPAEISEGCDRLIRRAVEFLRLLCPQ
ncbi:hypothetical protein SK128_010478 [Halocaridina rubra]|uniref:Uncharacterized protein n=1 Tax=Halocaridina rubra TaxID=373956 RepID=A0AAN9AEE8_HALRR